MDNCSVDLISGNIRKVGSVLIKNINSEVRNEYALNSYIFNYGRQVIFVCELANGFRFSSRKKGAEQLNVDCQVYLTGPYTNNDDVQITVSQKKQIISPSEGRMVMESWLL